MVPSECKFAARDGVLMSTSKDKAAKAQAETKDAVAKASEAAAKGRKAIEDMGKALRVGK